MSDFSVRSDNVDVEQVMRQIRTRIREKRGVDYTEEEIRELANVKLEKFIDPKGVRSNLLEEYRRLSSAEAPPPNFAFGEDTLFETHRAPIRWLRALLRPFLKLLFNPNPLIQALHIQADLNQRNAERHARLDGLHYEVMHNLVLELTRTGAEVKSLKMRLESMASRLDFDERRARALEGVVQYRAGAVPPLQVPTGQDQQPRRQEARRDDGRRDQQPRRDREQEPRRDRDQQQRQRPPQEAQPQGAPQPPREPGQEGNALDNDGNERRARRRRRRGRRRPGEDAGGRPQQDAGGRSQDAGGRQQEAGGGQEAAGRPQEAGGRQDAESRPQEAGRRQDAEGRPQESGGRQQEAADRNSESPRAPEFSAPPDLPSE